jgi:hypothetical protein
MELNGQLHALADFIHEERTSKMTSGQESVWDVEIFWM